MNYDRAPFQLTLWVRRLLVATAAVYLLQLTVFTSPWIIHTFGFVAPDLLARPWSPLTYAFLHGDFLHLLFNSLLLWMFGSPVEARLGSRRFIRLWLVAVLGGAALSFVLQPLAGSAPIIGASAGLFGVMLAFVLEWPDAPVFIFPIPVPIKAKWMVLGMVALDLVFAMRGPGSGVAHFAHLGGLAAAFLFLRGGTLFARSVRKPATERAPAVMVGRSLEGARRSERVAPPSPRASSGTSPLEDLNRVLDKINERGLASLTPDERRILDEMSRRFRKEH
jgi:membrane associated rhomboid family serine protease